MLPKPHAHGQIQGLHKLDPGVGCQPLSQWIGCWTTNPICFATNLYANVASFCFPAPLFCLVCKLSGAEIRTIKGGTRAPAPGAELVDGHTKITALALLAATASNLTAAATSCIPTVQGADCPSYT